MVETHTDVAICVSGWGSSSRASCPCRTALLVPAPLGTLPGGPWMNCQLLPSASPLSPLLSRCAEGSER
jgi:hypothetical protein